MTLRTAALIVAAGSGSRSGRALPKQFEPLAGRPMLAHSYGALSRHPAVDRVLVVIGAGQERALAAILGEVPFVIGGATRRQSVANGLAALADMDRVLIHDAARPFVPPAVVDRLLAALDEAPGAIPVLPVADTLLHAGTAGTVAREPLRRVQTPQAFRLDAIRTAHATWTGPEPTDDAQMLRASGGEVALVEGDTMLDKVTYPADFAAAEARLDIRSRTATGYDVHRFAEDEELWLGGVLIPHSKGLSGHSDADVVLHAITDAVLGTIAAGDIGLHFPPSDPQWRGAESGQFLRHAAGLVAERGGVIDFVDVTIVCEAPKIGPHREAIRARIGELLSLQPDQVSVKATTTERLGFTGRGEGIAALASATVRVPA
ncbi:bifunctional 2-C-methyl-D-erythritol 4-phosphate cytidylyltransferase/2-C-methyl-D-erythritol 2,4-cyclodiphosphate synthase [Sphingomonas aracearum]|uniref:Bifunctional enzyme IspD/IspF n=1 Tax=Sphingomonas aracearum TaxID=2283317 RepID=A0A369VX28_9SPHN|nr:bifunctional 2-C-methyl-D-erythritol 4-phosphate cytidylyltransferase/2-C-methyl-D-erythritol 2,4-cyclodiphosphate synthase [Sphingomonas aracearum]RDE06175.1 bifunctional 2-C-methyl-D-erythritol 4-phosphate cytidylyltransferase/2-C-methyl-D-erythritol 2,4-cyclodiphosphate synthase [Sphingomonas aracearum]